MLKQSLSVVVLAASLGLLAVLETGASAQERAVLPPMVGRGSDFCMAFSPDGKSLASAGLAEPAVLWDLASHKVHARLDSRAGGGCDFIAYAPDGKTVATTERDRVVRLWETASGKLLAELRGEAKYVGRADASNSTGIVAARLIPASVQP